MKILYPSGAATKDEIEEILKFSVEGRKRVKDQLMRLDSTYADTEFYYEDKEGKKHWVTTLEEKEYPNYYHKTIVEEGDEEPASPSVQSAPKEVVQTSKVVELKEQHLSFEENQKGITYDALFGDYLKDTKEIIITDPYIRIFFQARNLMELIETVIKNKSTVDAVSIHLVTISDDREPERQLEFFEQIQLSCQPAGVTFTWEFDTTETIHARHIVTDTGWKISLDRGLDIYQHYAMGDAFSLSNRLQEFRSCKAFEVTYIKVENNK